MEKKRLYWLIGGILTLVIVAGGFFWQSKREMALAPTENEKQMESNLTIQEGDQVMVEERRNVNVDDITASIVADLSEDENALTTEENAELSDVETGGNTITELGTSYDESEY